MNKIKEFFKSIDGKTIVKVITMVFALLLIIVVTIVDMGLDPTKLNFFTWLSNSLVLVGIMVYGLFMGESIGKDAQTKRKNGLYQTNLIKYNALVVQLECILIYFTQFYDMFRKKELRRKKINYLKNHNVDLEYCDLILDFVQLKDLHQLAQEEGLLLENGKIIPQQDENQLESISYVLKGNVGIDEPQPNYYLTAFGSTKVKSELEEPKSIDRQIDINKHTNRAIKIISSLAISIIWGMVTVNEFMGGDSDQARMTAWANLVSRITALLTSFLSGWSSAVIDTKLRARKLEGKYNMLIKFKSAYDNKEFTPMSKQEINKAKYDAVMKKREEELKNVVVPEIVLDPLQIEEEHDQ